MLDQIFRLLFKYPPLVFQQGDLSWGISRPVLVALLAAAALAVAALTTYKGTGGDRPLRDRVVLIGLRVGALLVLLICLLRPTLILKASVPQQNFVGVLLDDSRSMTIADSDGQPRSTFIQQQLSGPNAKLLDALSKRFVLRFFSFASSADRVPEAASLKYAGTATRLGQALERARDELSGLPLAGLVMVTDGADTSDASLDEPLASLKARSIPVFTVGLGQERFSKDIQVTRVEAPRVVLKGTALVVDVVLSQTGYSGQTVALNVEDEGRIAATQNVTLPADGESSTVRVRFTASDAGARTFRFKIAPQEGEQVTQNNVRDALIEVRDRKEKVLYFEGEPRFETKFVRRAMEDDKNLQVSILLRTAENKYWRGDVTSPDELISGFPKTREELFAYRAIILGSVEAAAFTPEQLRMLADFVNKRGGGLLMLGGRRAFAEGGWGGTPVGDVLPVVIDAGRPSAAYFSELSAKPTRDGRAVPRHADRRDRTGLGRQVGQHGAGLVGQSRSAGSSRARPSCSAPPTADDSIRSCWPISATDAARPSRCRFRTPGSGRWTRKSRSTDTTHAMFWRRLVRWLVDGVPDQVNLTTVHDRVEPGEAVRFTAEVLDTAYVEVNDAHVEAHITSPSGKVVDVPMEWTVEHDGEYGAVFNPDESGPLRNPRDRHARREGSRRQRDAPARLGGRRRVLRRGHARAAPATHRRRNRRPLLHAGQRRARCPKPSATADAA